MPWIAGDPKHDKAGHNLVTARSPDLAPMKTILVLGKFPSPVKLSPGVKIVKMWLFAQMCLPKIINESVCTPLA